MASPVVAVVVLNWHGRDDTLRCLRSLSASTYPHARVWLVENGCHEFSDDEVAGLVPGARCLRSARNLGFAGGCNLGIRASLDAGAELVLLLNNDATVAPDAVDALVRAALPDPAIGVVGAKILMQDAPSVLEGVGLSVDLRWGRLHQVGFGEVDRGQHDHRTEVVAVSGAAMLLRAPVCERLGGFDDRYFAYFEDVDLCLRARSAGFRVRVAPQARVWHRRRAATGGAASTRALYYAARNHLRLMVEHGGPGGGARRLRSIAVVLLNVAHALRGGSGPRGPRLRAVAAGVRDYRRGAVGAMPEVSTPAPGRGDAGERRPCPDRRS